MRLWAALALVIGFAEAALAAVGIRITEIQYHPPGTNRLEQWFELGNFSPTPVSLSGWRVDRGVTYAFPAGTVIAPGTEWVVAADPATFTRLNPGVTRVVGGWTGTLSFDGEELRIVDERGQTVDSVRYAAEGDWAIRRLGPPDNYSKRGWEWFAAHDGLGRTLELIQARLPGDAGQNWGASLVVGGTPGSTNSIARPDIAPLILEPAHSPAVPRSQEPVTVRARLVDENFEGLSAAVTWRVDGGVEFERVPMLDDGSHNDGARADGLFGAVIPGQPHGAVIEFYLTATDATGNARVYPSFQAPEENRTANLVFQVDDSVYGGVQPVYRVILARAEHEYLSRQIWGISPGSDAEVSGTFVTTDGILRSGGNAQVRYSAGFRNRGHGTRGAVPHNIHVTLPGDRPWGDRVGINLNTASTHSQHLGSALFRRLGLPMANSRPVQVRVNGVNLAGPGQEQFGSYAANDQIDSQAIRVLFPDDPDGNCYRGVREVGGGPRADFVWHGADPAGYTDAYFKETNRSLDDWSDLIGLIDALNRTPDAEYVERVRAVVNVEQWMRYFAANTLLGNEETSLATGYGDDYALYRGVADRRFVLMPYDADSLMGRGVTAFSSRNGLFRMTGEGTTHYIEALERFMKRPEFVRVYYRELIELSEALFNPSQMNPVLDNVLGSYVDPGTLATMKAFNADQVNYVRSQIPRALSVSHSLGLLHGYPASTNGTINLRGQAHAARTRAVHVNGIPAAWTAWRGTWILNGYTLNPGLNRLRVEAFDEDGREIDRVFLDVINAASGPGLDAGASVTADTTWRADAGPYRILSSLVVGSGATLTIEPGTAVYLGAGATLTVNGRLLAEGTPARTIRFTREPGGGAAWGGMVIRGGPGSPETRIAHAHFEFNGDTAIHSEGGTVLLDHLTFGGIDQPYLSLDSSSFVVSHCEFPAPGAEFEPVHGSGGIKAGGRGIIRDSFFGPTQGYNDVIDFTGGNRPGGPILHVLNNVFAGASDDVLDLDGTDAWIEGNLFLHVHRNGSPDSASAVSGGADSGRTSEITVVGNLFYDCDHAATAKEGNFFVLFNNTIVRQTRAGGVDTDGAVVNFADDGTAQGAGMHLEGNIILDAEKLTRNRTTARLTLVNNILPFEWTGAGGGNTTSDPRFERVPGLAETFFASFREAQVLREWFRLRPDSPGIGAGSQGNDLGTGARRGVILSGAPSAITSATSATVQVGWVRGGDVAPAAGWPDGAGYTHYRWRINGGPWSGDRPVTEPILLSGLLPGPQTLEAVGRLDSGLYQDDPALGPSGAGIDSARWTVDPAWVPVVAPKVRIHEILANNRSIPSTTGRTPDWIEIHNGGSEPVDMAGMRLTDDPAAPDRFVFPAGTTIAAGGFLVLRAEAVDGEAGMQTGFGLNQDGDGLWLYDRAAGGGALLDQVVFGPQVPDLSLGRTGSGVWTLCRPTFGAENLVQACAEPGAVRINEWLADARFVADSDFIELYNPTALPVPIGGCFLSDAAGSRFRHRVAPLSYIGAGSLVVFIADGEPERGADHLNFRLNADAGVILFSGADGTIIDSVDYGPQRTDIAEGRAPNGGAVVTAFRQPTPGAANPGGRLEECTLATVSVPLMRLDGRWAYNESSNLDGSPWHLPAYDDLNWPTGAGLFGVEDCGCLPAPGIDTALRLGRTTYYFRSRFETVTNLTGCRLNFTAVLDDGAVIYLDGRPVVTNGMPVGVPVYATEASRTVGNAGLQFFSVDGVDLVSGVHTLAVELHQSDSGSSDLVFGLALDAVRIFTNCAPGAAATLALNEVAARSGTGNNSMSGETGDWVEVHNYGVSPVDLSGFRLTDDIGFTRKFVFPPGASIGSGERWVIGFDAARPASSTNTGFGLNAAGGSVFLFDNEAHGGSLLDGLTYGLQAAGFTLGRLPEGTGEWTLTVPTPGSRNQAAALGTVASLRINEWMADPLQGDDWFELHNAGDQPVPLEGLTLTDHLGEPARSPIPPLSYVGVGAGGFVLFTADGVIGNGADHVAFSLSRAGEQLGLFDPRGVAIDTVTFGRQGTGVSEGRFPDGAPLIRSFPDGSTPGRSNTVPLADLDGDGMPDDWELHYFGTLDRNGLLDLDGDGLRDGEELALGSDPTDPRSGMRVEARVAVDGRLALRWTALAGRAYTVQYTEDLSGGTWLTLAEISAVQATGPIEVPDPTPANRSARFYRVLSPSSP